MAPEWQVAYLKNAVFRGAAVKLWGSLTARHRNNASKYGPCPITREEFTEWLWERSHKGLTWRCEYSDALLQLMGSTQAYRLSLDHKMPLSRGGTSSLDNLAICSESVNKVKGILSTSSYADFRDLIESWPDVERDDIIRRLQAYRPIWRTGK